MRKHAIAFLAALSILVLTSVPVLAKGPGGGGPTCPYPYTLSQEYCPFGYYVCVTSQPGWVSPVYYSC